MHNKLMSNLPEHAPQCRLDDQRIQAEHKAEERRRHGGGTDEEIFNDEEVGRSAAAAVFTEAGQMQERPGERISSSGGGGRRPRPSGPLSPEAQDINNMGESDGDSGDNSGREAAAGSGSGSEPADFDAAQDIMPSHNSRLDLEEGGGGGSGTVVSSSDNEATDGNQTRGGAGMAKGSLHDVSRAVENIRLASASQLAAKAAAAGSRGAGGGTTSTDASSPTPPPGRRRSSYLTRDLDGAKRRDSQNIAAERRAEAKNAAKALAAAGGVGAGVGGLTYKNVSNHSMASLQHSSSSLHQEQQPDSGGVPAASLSATGLSYEPSPADATVAAAASLAVTGTSSSAPAPPQAALAPTKPPKEALVKVDSKRGMSVESQQPTVATAATTEVGADSVTTNGSSPTRGGGGKKSVGTGGDGSAPGGGEGGGKDSGDDDDEREGGAEPELEDNTSVALSSVALPFKVDSTTMLQRTCLNPNYSLRNQLYLSFGTVSAVALLFVVMTAIITTAVAGNKVKSMSRQNLEAWAKLQLGHSSRKVADTITRKLSNFDGLASIMMETARDRFVGYPDHPGYANDSKLPFLHHSHTETRYGYPLKSDPLPLDWQMVSNVNTSNVKEHIQERSDWYERGTGANKDSILISTASATYRMQGQCDPSITDPDNKAFYPGCTNANNDVSAGGAVRPTETAGLIASKAADLNFVLKPLYEYHKEARTLGYFFANSGAGSVMAYPHEMRDGRSSYTSAGCEWMAEPNPLDPSRPVGSRAVIDACHAEGERVNGREYNPLERGWCQAQALNPLRTVNVGPYLDAFKEGLWLMTFGRAVYDRLTGEFIACTLADVGVDQIAEIVEDVKIGETSEISLVRWDDKGTVVASPRWDSFSATSTTTVLDEDLGLGVDEKTFQQIRSVVDFSKPWDPTEVRDTFEKIIFRTKGKLVSAFPIPVPPAEYDADYRPEFLVVSSIDIDEVFAAVNEMDAAVSESVAELIRDTLIVGFVGLAVIVIVIYIVGLYLTKPLEGINKIGDQIVDTFGDHDQAIDYSLANTLWCSPRTEISDLAREFQQMVSDFSGTGTAKIVKQKFTEVLNPFTLFEEFQDLYESRRDEYFPYMYRDSTDCDRGLSLLEYERAQAEGGPSLKLPHRRHFGPNIKAPDATLADATSQMSLKRKNRVMSSPLFRWVVASIMTPLLVTMVIISALVTYEISQLFPTLVVDVQEAFIGLETQALATTAGLRASFAGEVMDQAIRDLHLLTRVASWLLFGALQRSDVFIDLVTGSEECKVYPNDGSCPMMTNRYTAPCDCSWKDGWGAECYDYDEDLDSRYLQRVFYEGLSQDIWPNGDRNSTTFPLVATTAELTKWWDDVDFVPGAEKGDLAAGYATTYDRLRTLAALGVMQIPLYNYGSSGTSGRPLATYIGFESDGMFSGYVGCKHSHAQYAHWKSSEGNGAAKLRPELCPLGKHGYDPRCRGWYDSGKKIAKKGGNPLHVTTPYLFASGTTAQSSTLPLNDPTTGKHVGQALVDFLPEDIVVSLRSENTPLADKGFPVLITAQPDSFGADTVVGPGYSIEGGQGYPIGDLVLPYDCSDAKDVQCANRREFENILLDMRAGNSASTSFVRTTATGETENVYFAYAPVMSHDFAPKNSSDFSRGVDSYDSLIFSLAVAEPESGFLRPFQDSIDVQRSVNIALGVLLALIVIAACVVTLITSRVTVSITKPLTQLLELVQNVNRSDIKDDLPELHGGSREVSQVYGTFERLYKVIRFANSAFFAGDLDKAYSVLSDALAVFMQLNNKKAIAVANNNLGITMLTMYRTLQSVGEDTVCGMTSEDIIDRGTLYFNQAIALGEEALDQINEEEGWSKNYLIFMQQLSNRYFNRAMFFLSVREDHEQPDEAERQGIKDLTVTRELDTEVAENGGEEVFQDDESARFALVLSRIRGLLILMGMSYPDDWGIEELFEEAIEELSEATKNPKHAIFRDVSAAGMMQQLDADLIEFVEVDRDGIIMAARIGIRMLIEDEYVLPDAAQKATITLLHYLDVVEEAGIPNPKAPETRASLRNYLAIFSRSLECPKEGDVQRRSSMRRSSMRRSSMKQSTRGDVTMEMF